MKKSDERPQARLRDFSEGYYLVENVKCVEFTGNKAVVNDQLYTLMEQAADKPLIKAGDNHYWPDWEVAVPADTIALPDFGGMNDSPHVLLAKDTRAKDMLHDGSVSDPSL